MNPTPEQPIQKGIAEQTAFRVLLALGLTHLLNDTLQSIIPAIYPTIQLRLQLDYTQIGLITLVLQLCSSIFQPVVGWYTDKKPQPYSLPIGMTFTLCGILSLSFANSLPAILGSVALTGIGSSIFHPEASRLAHLASGGRYGTAQSIFQVGGNLGSSVGPLLAALIIAPYGQHYVGLFAILALIAIVVMLRISGWYKRNLPRFKAKRAAIKEHKQNPFSKNRTLFILMLLLVLLFSKYVYLASLTSYYTFYLMHKFGVGIQAAQLYLFIFLFSVAIGTLLGGPIGDKIGRKYVIWGSIFGVAPFTLLMPHMGLAATCGLSICIGLILSSAFSAILVYAQELLPGKVGLISGLFFGLAFGIAGIAAAILGRVADLKGIDYVYELCAFLPLIGVVAFLLPDIRKGKQ